MTRNPFLMTLMIGFFAFFAMGSMCDPEIDPVCPEGEKECNGECIPEDEECPSEGNCPEGQVECADGTCADTPEECEGGVLGCREDGTCEPNFYSDQDMGDHPTGSYGLRQLRTGGGLEAANSNGDILAVNAYAEDQAVHYWQMTEVDDDQMVVNVFQDGIIVNRVFEFLNPEGEVILEQNPLVEATPDEADYSPLLQVWYVHVPDGYTANTIKSTETLQQAADDFETTGIWLEPTGSVILVEITDPSVGFDRIEDIDTSLQPFVVPVWKNRQVANAWFGFLTSHEDEVSIWVEDQDDWTYMPVPLPANLLQFQGCPGRIVYEELNQVGNSLYSPVVTRIYVDPKGADCEALPTNTEDIFDAIEAGTYEFSTWQSIAMVTSMFPY
ncbi:MAG: hypothetical protein ACOCVR_01940 [Myxococcota bacterium]